MNAIWTSFSLAWNLLTIIPLPSGSHTDVRPHTLASSLGWYPFVGFLLGTILILTDRLCSEMFPDLVVNLLLLIIQSPCTTLMVSFIYIIEYNYEYGFEYKFDIRRSRG